MSKAFQPTQLQQLTAGQPTVIKADTWNAFAKHVEQSHTAELPMKPQESNTLIICKNTSGSTIYAFHLVAITYPELLTTNNILERTYNATLTLDGREPTEQCLLGITQEAIADGEAGYVLIYGVSPLSTANDINAPNSMTAEKASDWYLTPAYYFAARTFIYTNRPSQIKLLRRYYSENGSQSPCLIYLDNGIRQPKPYFETSFAKYLSSYITVTHDSFDCLIVDFESDQVISKTVPSITYNRTGNSSNKTDVFLVYFKASDTFNISSDLSYNNATPTAFCRLGYFDSWRFINTCIGKPVLLPLRNHMLDSPAFNITYSVADGKIYVGKGKALIVGTGLGAGSNNAYTISNDADGNAFVVDDTYYVYATYKLSTSAFEIKAYKKANTAHFTYSSGKFRPDSDETAVMLGEVCFGVYKHQMFKGSYLPMFLDIDMRNPT